MHGGKILTIHKNIYNKYMFTETFVRFKSNKSYKEFKSYDYKLDSSVSRAKSTIFKLTMFNEFKFFYTQTIDSKYDRTNLSQFMAKFRNIIKYLHKLFPDKVFKYVVVPEYHKDNCCWHLHGFLSKDFDFIKYINKNGFYSIDYLDNLGFNSVSVIRSPEACTKYFCKYITKELLSSRGKNENVYYCSNGLKRGNLVSEKLFSQIAPIHYDFKSPYVFKTTIDEKKYYNFVTNLENNYKYYYHDIVTT